MGYVLPWGQMSFWGATVITNLFSAIPFVGESIVTFLWGGFSVDNPTLNRFFSLHYLMPFLIAGVVVLHIVALHRFGSNNPIGIDATGPQDTISFHPYYTIKDMVGIAVFLLLLATAVFFFPNAMGHPDNYIPANPMQTPAHIVPEWYFHRSMPFCERCLTTWRRSADVQRHFCAVHPAMAGSLACAFGALPPGFSPLLLAALHRLPCAWLSRWYAGRRYLCRAFTNCHCLVLLALPRHPSTSERVRNDAAITQINFRTGPGYSQGSSLMRNFLIAAVTTIVAAAGHRRQLRRVVGMSHYKRRLEFFWTIRLF